MLLSCYCTTVTVFLLQCYISVTSVLLYFYCSVTLVLLQCYCNVSAVLLQSYQRVTLVLLYCYCIVKLLIADLRVPCISSLYIPHCSHRPGGTNINDTSVIRKRNLNGQIRQTAVQADSRLWTRQEI